LEKPNDKISVSQLREEAKTLGIQNQQTFEARTHRRHRRQENVKRQKIRKAEGFRRRQL
jgi:hypothetical protein